MCSECEEALYRKPRENRTAPEIHANLEAEIASICSGREPLPNSVREFFEPRFAHDFGDIRVTLVDGSQRRCTMSMHRSHDAQPYRVCARTGHIMLASQRSSRRPTCRTIVAAFAPPLFTGDFGNVSDRISYGSLRCCP